MWTLSNPEDRAVLADHLMDLGRYSVERMRWMVGIRAVSAYANANADADADANANANANANADADADADANANVNAYADADADANAYANAYAYADANADAYANANAYADADADADANAYAGEKEMRAGLWAVTVWQGTRSVIRVGWFRHDQGDEWDCHWTTPYRGEYDTRLSDVWEKGPSAAKKWTWGPVLESCVSRLHMVPLAKLDPDKWRELCPKPEGW